MFPAAYYLPTWADLGWLLILVVFCTVISFEMQLNSLKHISAFTANLTYNLEPVYGIILAFMVFRENKYLHNQFLQGRPRILLAVILPDAAGKKTGKGRRSQINRSRDPGW